MTFCVCHIFPQLPQPASELFRKFIGHSLTSSFLVPNRDWQRKYQETKEEIQRLEAKLQGDDQQYRDVQRQLNDLRVRRTFPRSSQEDSC